MTTTPTGDLRARLAAALADACAVPHPERLSVYDLADALLPVVESYGRACAATALRDAADHFDADRRTGEWLRARVGTLQANPEDDGEDRYGLTRSDYHGQMH